MLQTASALDLIFRDASLPGRNGTVDIGVHHGRIVAIGAGLVADAPVVELRGRLAIPGFVDTHIHLDKACLLGRCSHQHGGLDEAIRMVSALKRGFTPEDVYLRGARILEMAIAKGTTKMRTHVEVDPRVGLRSFEAVKALRDDYRWALDLSICVFPQEGLTNDPGTEELLIEALECGADVLGGCPYTDTAPVEQIERLFALASRFDVDLDFHLDFDLDPSWFHLDNVCRQTELHRYQNRVAVGHVTKLSALAPDRLARVAKQIASAGLAVTVLPATDLYLMGRQATHNVPRGLTPAHRLAAEGIVCSIATNNVLNPFTPFGDCSLLRMANLYANVAQVEPSSFGLCLDLVTALPARLMNLRDYGIAVRHAADIVVLDAPGPIEAVAEIAEPIMGYKNGRLIFTHPPAELRRPDMVMPETDLRPGRSSATPAPTSHGP